MYGILDPSFLKKVQRNLSNGIEEIASSNFCLKKNRINMRSSVRWNTLIN